MHIFQASNLLYSICETNVSGLPDYIVLNVLTQLRKCQEGDLPHYYATVIFWLIIHKLLLQLCPLTAHHGDVTVSSQDRVWLYRMIGTKLISATHTLQLTFLRHSCLYHIQAITCKTVGNVDGIL